MVKLHFTYAGKASLFHTSAVKAADSNVHLDDKFGLPPLQFLLTVFKEFS